MQIAIASDLCPQLRNEPLFMERKIPKALQSFLEACDFVVANMECPLIVSPSPIKKIGANLSASVDCAQGIRDLGIHVMTLANNHIMDHGLAGIESTIAALSQVGIETFGAGKNLEEAIRPYHKTFGENDIYLLTYAENEFNVADKNRPGASPLDIRLIVRQLIAAPKHALKIVILHGGNEHYQLPNPWLRDTCRLIVELGASVVVVQHTHCVGTYEEYHNGLILYGQGNFIFDKMQPANRVLWDNGVLLTLEVHRNQLQAWRVVPYHQSPAVGMLRFTDEAESASILEAMAKRSEIVRSEDQLEKHWEDYCQKRKMGYQNYLLGYGSFMRRLNWHFHIADRMNDKTKMNIGNILRCQAHYEILRAIYSQENTTPKLK